MWSTDQRVFVKIFNRQRFSERDTAEKPHKFARNWSDSVSITQPFTGWARRKNKWVNGYFLPPFFVHLVSYTLALFQPGMADYTRHQYFRPNKLSHIWFENVLPGLQVQFRVKTQPLVKFLHFMKCWPHKSLSHITNQICMQINNVTAVLGYLHSVHTFLCKSIMHRLLI